MLNNWTYALAFVYNEGDLPEPGETIRWHGVANYAEEDSEYGGSGELPIDSDAGGAWIVWDQDLLFKTHLNSNTSPTLLYAETDRILVEPVSFEYVTVNIGGVNKRYVVTLQATANSCAFEPKPKKPRKPPRIYPNGGGTRKSTSSAAGAMPPSRPKRPVLIGHDVCRNSQGNEVSRVAVYK